MITHGDSRAHTASGSRALARLCAARHPHRVSNPARREGAGSLPPQPSLYPPPSLSREEEGPRGRAHIAHWLGRCSDTPSPSPCSAEGNWGEGASGLQGWAGGCAFSLGRLKGKFMLSVPASRGNTMSLQHVGRCIYSTRRLRLWPTWGQTRDGCLKQGFL